jgi:hypothetical protein
MADDPDPVPPLRGPLFVDAATKASSDTLEWRRTLPAAARDGGHEVALRENVRWVTPLGVETASME